MLSVSSNSAPYNPERLTYEFIQVLPYHLELYSYRSRERRRVIHTGTGRGMNWKSECIVIKQLWVIVKTLLFDSASQTGLFFCTLQVLFWLMCLVINLHVEISLTVDQPMTARLIIRSALQCGKYSNCTKITLRKLQICTLYMLLICFDNSSTFAFVSLFTQPFSSWQEIRTWNKITYLMLLWLWNFYSHVFLLRLCLTS